MLPFVLAAGLAPPPAAPAPDPRATAIVRKVQTWLDGAEGNLRDIVTDSSIAAPEVIPERDGSRRLVFRVTVNFNRAFYDKLRVWQQEWPDDAGAPELTSLGKQLRRLNRYGIFLGLYGADGDLIAKAPVVKNPYFANLLEDYYEDRAGDLVPVAHSQAFRDRPENVEPLLRRGDLAPLAAPALAERFVPLFQAETITRKDVVLQVAPEDISNAKSYRLEMEATGN